MIAYLSRNGRTEGRTEKGGQPDDQGNEDTTLKEYHWRQPMPEYQIVDYECARRAGEHEKGNQEHNQLEDW